jgi:hypothetical protein
MFNKSIEICGRFLRITTKNGMGIAESIHYIPFKNISLMTIVNGTLLQFEAHNKVYDLGFKDRIECGNTLSSILQHVEELPTCMQQKLV